MWISRQHKSKGFTLIELLIVIAIIGILTTVGTVSLVQARRRTRDTKRVSDIQQVRNALVIYSNTRATYPPALSSTTAADIELGGVEAGCLDDSDAGFNATGTCSGLSIMDRVPGEQFPSRPDYLYRKTDSAAYEVTFGLEGEIGDLRDANGDGLCVATREGITC